MKYEFMKPFISEEEYRILLAELEKRRAQDRFAEIIWAIDMNLKLTYLSPMAGNLLGYSQEEMLKKTLDELITPESFSLVSKAFTDALSMDSIDAILQIPRMIRVEAKHQDGASIWLESSWLLLRDEKKTPLGALGFARDISDQVRVLEALTESEEKYRALTGQPVLGITIAQANPLRIVYVNDAIEKMLYYSREEMLHWKEEEVYKLVHPEDRAPFFARFRDRLEKKPVPESFEFRAIRKDGEILWFEVHGARIVYQGELAVLAIFIEVTRRHSAQKEAEDARKFTEFLIDLMSHDLNNIHQGMMTGLELISFQEKITPHSKMLLESAISQLQRAADLISRVRRLSDAKSSAMQQVRTDIYIPVSKAIASIKSTFPSRRIMVNSNISPGAYFVRGTEFLVDVFYNLFHNAVKYDTKEPVVLDINAGLSTDKSLLQVTVEDRGVGVPDSKKGGILGRLDEGKTAVSGIGLTLAKQIIDLCNGRIWVEDRISGDFSKGARFVIQLPIVNV
ncbi:MAG: PAS domain S-box protein [Candidatus Thorarchaeota archaeon]